MTTVGEWEVGYRAARGARARLGLGLDAPVTDPLLTIEELGGVPVTVLELPLGIAGLQGCKQGSCYIFINGHEPVVRQRFTLAHEFGHIELGHSGSIDYIDDVDASGQKPPREAQADGFAAEFLAPLDGVKRWLAVKGEPQLDLETVVRLGDHFQISAEVALYRLQQARHVTKPRLAPLLDEIAEGRHAQLSARLGLRDCQDTLAQIKESDALPRLPRATMTEAANAYERGLLTAEQIAELLEAPLEAIQAEFDRRGVTAGHHEPDY